MRDAKNDGRKALGILREHYLGKGKPRIISLYSELTSLKMDEHERVTDYVIRAETAATCLKTTGENISDSLLVAMVLKGLPQRFRTFVTVITQKEKDANFTEFKIALRSYEETEKTQSDQSVTHESGISDNVRYPRRERKPPAHLQDFATDFSDSDQLLSNIDYCYQVSVFPQTFKEATKSPESKYWQVTMADEMNSLKENNTFTLTSLPNGMNSVGGRWVYTIKENADGSKNYKDMWLKVIAK